MQPDGWLFPRKMFFTEQNIKEINIKEERNCFQVHDKITTELGRGEIACKKLRFTWMEHFRKFHPIFAWPGSKLQP
jgi:hypothetical protein